MVILRCVLLLCLVSQAWAQDSGGEDLQAQLQELDSGVAALRELDRRIEGVAEENREPLRFRRDERSFKLLLTLDKLVRAVAELPADDPLRQEVEKRLQEDLANAGDSVFQLLQGVNKRIATNTAQLESLSGTSLVATEAYLNSLEQLRIQYYQGLVDVIEGRKLLGLPAEEVTAPLQDALYIHAETLAGRLEFTGTALKDIQGRLEQDPANADLQASVIDMGNEHQLNLQRLESLVGLMERLGLDDSAYKSVLIQQSDSLSLQVLETGVVLSLLQDAWDAVRETLTANGPDILFRLLIFVLILLVFRFLSRLTRRAVTAACERPGVEMSTLLKDVLVSISGGTVMAIGFLMALSQVGISLGPMLAGLGVAGFVVGFALQDTLGNFAAGGMILIYRPYDVDDYVEVAGASGFVKKMSLVSTTITTFDNQTLVVPNSKIWGDVIKNVTAQKVRRVDLVFGIGYGDDIEKAERVLNDILESHDKVLDKPEAMVKVHTLGESSVDFVTRPWVRTEDYWDVYWDITREVKLRFDREGISIPFPQRDVHLFQEAT
jgi:small conductance mechanosensitive channel